MTPKEEDRSDFQICTCIALNCWHPKGKCDEPPVRRGGICTTCRFHAMDHQTVPAK